MGIPRDIVTKQEKFELIIRADDMPSTDERFSVDNPSLGDNYKPLDAYFRNSNGEIIRRIYNKGEYKVSNQLLPRLAFQIFQSSIEALSDEDKKNFPICQYSSDTEMIRGIFSSKEEFRKYRKTFESMTYRYDDGKQFVIYCWNIFSTLLFVQECLIRFGSEGDEFVLIYREKDEKEAADSNDEEVANEGREMGLSGYQNPYSVQLLESKNIIFRGAPGTGKSYLAKEIAADIISNGNISDFLELTNEQKQQVGFVQFHPSYDYTDFVEGLRPMTNPDGSMGFELQDGVFKRFVNRARRNYEDSQKSKEVIEKEASVQEIMEDYFSNIELGVDELEIARGTKFTITNIDDRHINISIPENAVSNKLSLSINELREMLESVQEFPKVKDVTQFLGRVHGAQGDSYLLAIFNAIKSRKVSTPQPVVQQVKQKPYIFIIDEINRGEISKIFGELFFSIDPGYRGRLGEISTQYANLHETDEKFFIPENVYIIGTMNDIDRSVDSFDFAMRRRFRFIEIKANEHLDMLDSLGDQKEEAVRRLLSLNNERISHAILLASIRIVCRPSKSCRTSSGVKPCTPFQ